jgi:hypothetical protein
MAKNTKPKPKHRWTVDEYYGTKKGPYERNWAKEPVTSEEWKNFSQDVKDRKKKFKSAIKIKQEKREAPAKQVDQYNKLRKNVNKTRYSL